MSRPMAPAWLSIAVVLVAGAAGCGGTGSGPAAAVSPSVPASGAAAAATATVVPTMTPEPPAPSLAEPPAATLAAEGGDPVAGSIGSFTWGDGGSDSPWLPGAQITVGAGEPLTLTLAGDVPVTDWAVKRVPAGTADGAGSVAVGAGSAAPITFMAPGPGAWSVQVVVTFGEDLGSAAYYWELNVT